MSDEWFKGDKWRPKIEVNDPETNLPLNLGSDKPSAHMLWADGTETTVTVLKDGEAFAGEVTLTVVGEATLVVDGPDPYVKTAVESIYVNPRPSGAHP